VKGFLPADNSFYGIESCRILRDNRPPLFFVADLQSTNRRRRRNKSRLVRSAVGVSTFVLMLLPLMVLPLMVPASWPGNQPIVQDYFTHLPLRGQRSPSLLMAPATRLSGSSTPTQSCGPMMPTIWPLSSINQARTSGATRRDQCCSSLLRPSRTGWSRRAERSGYLWPAQLRRRDLGTARVILTDESHLQGLSCRFG